MSYRQTVTVVVESPEPLTPDVISRDDYPGVVVGEPTISDLQVEKASPLNRKRLIEVAQWAAAEYAKEQLGLPSEWNQGSWLKAREGVQVGPQFEIEGTLCGTACCIAGKVALDEGATPATIDQAGKFVPVNEVDPEELFLGIDFSRVIPPGETDVVSVSVYARQVLGLDEYQASRLFEGSNDLEVILDLVREFLEGDTQRERVFVPVEPEPEAPEVIPAWDEDKVYAGDSGARVTYNGKIYQISPSTICSSGNPENHPTCWDLVTDDGVVPQDDDEDDDEIALAPVDDDDDDDDDVPLWVQNGGLSAKPYPQGTVVRDAAGNRYRANGGFFHNTWELATCPSCWTKIS